MRLKYLVVSLGLIVAAEAGLAQQPTASVPVTPGTRVRVKTPTLVAPLVANFLEQRGDTLVFIEDGRGRGVWSFDIAQIERLEMTAGEAARNRRPIARGAVIGGGIGLLAGLLFAAAVEPSDSTKEYNRLLTGAAGAGAGAAIGGFIGSRVKSERWINVPLGRGFSFLPGRRGFTFALTLR